VAVPDRCAHGPHLRIEMSAFWMYVVRETRAV